MPWHVVSGHSGCPSSRPWAVVKDSDGSVAGCHASESDANAQMAALYANEGDNSVSIVEPVRATIQPKVIRLPKKVVEQVELVAAAVEAPPVEDPAAVQSEGPDDRWNGVLAVEGVETGDGRIFAENSLEWRDLPLPLYWQRQTADGHNASVIVGSIDRIWRDGSLIRGSGRFNLNAPENGVSRADAWDAYQLVLDKFMRGVSVTLDNIKENDVEVVWPTEMEEDDGTGGLFMEPEQVIFHHGRIIDGTLTGQPALQQAFVEIGPFQGEDVVAPAAFTAVGTHSTATSDGSWDAGVNVARLKSPLKASVARDVFAWIADGAGDTLTKSDCKFPHHEVGADGTPGAANLTACSAGIGILNGGRGGASIPASDRQGVYNHLAAHLRDADREPPALASIEDVEQLAAMTAALSVPVSPPAAWFSDPGFDDVTPLQVGDDGWVRGHLARWGTCHTSFSGTCVTPPLESEFSFFTTGELVTREGTRVPVGQLTLGTGHAPANLGARPAAVHYDHTGYAVADVAAGADEFGIWVAGALCPDVDEVTVRRLRASALSGDWRRIGGSLRLVAALVVNVPGFPIPRTRTHNHDGAQTALVAAGIVPNAEMHEAAKIRVPRPLIDLLAASIGRDPASRRSELNEMIHGKV